MLLCLLLTETVITKANSYMIFTVLLDYLLCKKKIWTNLGSKMLWFEQKKFLTCLQAQLENKGRIELL